MPPDKSFPDIKQEAHGDWPGEFLLKGTDITGLVLILMISDQCTYTCLHHNTPFYAFISHILTFIRFPDFFMIGEWHLCMKLRQELKGK